MIKENLNIGDRVCTVYSVDNAKVLLIQPVDDHDIEVLDSEVSYIEENAGKNFILAAFKINDWNNELSPWQAPPVFGKEGFGCGAGKTLEYIEDILIPQIIKKYALAEDIPIITGGYSLAALFSLWAIYSSDKFKACAAASPSVWFPKWIEYVQNNSPKAEYIYLSLGDKEEKTKNKIMAAVGECIVKQYEILQSNGIDTILEWNAGNHFKDADIRTAKGFVWCVGHL